MSRVADLGLTAVEAGSLELSVEGVRLLSHPPTRAKLQQALVHDSFRAFQLVTEFEGFVDLERRQLWEDCGHRFASVGDFERAFEEAVARVVDVAQPRRDLEALFARFPRQAGVLVRRLAAIDDYWRREGTPLNDGETSRWRRVAARPVSKRRGRPLARRRGAGRPARRRRARAQGPPGGDEGPEPPGPELARRVATRAACGWGAP